MEWIGIVAPVLGFLALLVLLAPLLLLLLLGVIVLPLAHLLRAPLTLARVSFDCSFRRQRANVTFLTAPGREAPLDVVACSIYGDGPVGCQKPCLPLATAQATPSPMVARFALLADGAAYRDAPGAPQRTLSVS
jgi:hypothetical protein